MARRPGSAVFRLAGFPVQVRPGFAFFLVLVIAAQGPEFGIPFAVFVGAFTLLHELGHALAARRAGARAAISLDFMAGYASFVPTRPLTRGDRITIALAGPLAQIVCGIVAYVAVSGRLDWPDWSHPLEVAALWAGPVLGLLNLAPVLPFDGGHVALALVEFVTPRHARRIMQAVTIVASAAVIVWLGTDPDNLPFLVFAAIPLFTVVAQLGEERGRVRAARTRDDLEAAEAAAWAAGSANGTASFPRGCAPSPWFRAWQQLRDGQPDVAVALLLDDYTATGQTGPGPGAGGVVRPAHIGSGVPRWWPPDTAPVEHLRAIVSLLPDELPAPGRPVAAHAMADVLIRTGQAERAGRIAADAYGRSRAPLLAIDVARCAALMDDESTARAWLAAARRDLPAAQLAALVARHPELHAQARGT